ncbi:terminase small subunit [Roseicitreum antarcticum]|uniref:Phage terminase small subunit n=1 Tax=Roseicitreum antarcticum TaxID=564137 RepID=A0A1H3E4L3_9RHOB|nr:terminase small subunit [Roseicitreum antarcticum]SDX73621.1 phage terminase small subunit [Roseicitreum antarcticum]
MAGLSDKQTKFVDEYLIDLNATQAAIRAGYSPKTAYSQGQRLLKKDEVQARIQERRKDAQKRAEVTLDDVLLEYKRIAFTGMSKFLRISPDGDPIIDLSACTPEDLDLLAESSIEDFTEGRGEDARDIRRVKIKTMDRLKALETLGKHLGMGDKAANAAVDRLAEAVKEISRRGSAAPISTARPSGNKQP